MIDLVPAGAVHGEVLAAMHRVCFVQPWSAGSMAATLAMPGAAGLIAVAEGSGPAGLVLWRSAAGEAEILTLAVLPGRRRAGLGRRLLDAALAGAAEAGAAAMFLEAAADNAAALALYQGAGFAEIGRRRGYYGSVDAIAMRRDISG
jgi:ribosomal-protein-alanine N-acetyltransferase